MKKIVTIYSKLIEVLNISLSARNSSAEDPKMNLRTEISWLIVGFKVRF